MLAFFSLLHRKEVAFFVLEARESPDQEQNPWTKNRGETGQKTEVFLYRCDIMDDIREEGETNFLARGLLKGKYPDFASMPEVGTRVSSPASLAFGG
jgi:hypothetical protein